MAVTLCSINDKENGMLQEEEYNVPATTSLTSCDVLVPVSAMQVPDFTSNAAFSLIPGKMNCETLKTNKKLHLSPQTSGYNVSSSNCDNSEDGVGDSGDSFRSFNQPAYSNIIKLKLKSCSSLNRLHKKPYIVYKKGSAKSSALTKYRPVPVDERKFVCPVCHRAFIQHNYLIRHMFSHQNKKPFSCDAKGCEKSNTNFALLKHHKECYHNITSVIQDSDAVSPHPDDISTTSIVISETSGLEQLSSESQLQLNTFNQNQYTSKQIEVLLDTGNKYDNRQSQEQYNSQTINTAVSLVAQDYGQNTLCSQDINSERMLEKREIVENYLDVKEMHEQTASLKLPDYQNQSKENNFSNFSQQQQPGIVNSQEAQQLSLVVPKFQTSLRNASPTVLTSYLVNTDVDTTSITSGGSLFQFLQKQTVFSSAISNLLSNNSGTNVFQNTPTALQTSHRKTCYPLVKQMLYSSQTLNLNYTNWMKKLNITPESFHPQFRSHHPSDQLTYLFTQGKPYNHSNNVTTDLGNISNRIQYTPLPVSQNRRVAMIPNSIRQLLSSETQSAASQLQFLAFLWSVSQNIGALSDSDRQKQRQWNPQIINISSNLTDERLMPNTSHSEGTVNSEQALILQETTKNNSNIIKTVDNSDLMQLSKYQNQHEYQQPEILNSQQVHQLFPDVSSCQVSQINPSPTIFGHMIKTQDDSTIYATMEENSLSFCKQQDQTVDHLERAGSLTTCNRTSYVPNKLIAPGDPLLENNPLTPQDQPKFPNYLYLLVPRGQSEGLHFTQKAFLPPSYPSDHSYNKKPDNVSRLKSRKTKICVESRAVKCTLCHKKFKNRFGLNGHMKLHGGYRAQRCCYCLKPRANVRCCYIRCKKVFHFPHCGLKNYTLDEFIGKPDCYCINHRPRQEVREKDGRGSGVSDLTCSICLYHIENKESHDVLRAPCCMYTSFHRTCVQRLALHAGHFFKCPVCNNKDLFNTEMWKHGIHTQERNTFFKQEENAFGEHRIKYCQCDATYCICPKGRKFSSKESDWEILVCKACGSQGCHLLCRDPDCPKPFWECPRCVDITEKLKCRMSETKSNNMNDNDFMELKASGESSHSELAHKVLLAQNKKRTENLVEVSATLEESGKERNDVTSITDFDIREKMLHECKVKLVHLEDLYHQHQRDFTVMSFQDDNFKKKANVSEEKNSKSFQISKQVTDSDKVTQSKVTQKGSTNLSLGKSANFEHWSNPWKDFNDVNLTSNKPVFFQINHGVTPGMYRLDIFMRQDDGKPPVKLGFRNLSLPSVNPNDKNQPISTVTLEQLLCDSVSRTKDENQSNCSTSSSEIRDFKSSSEEKVGPESVLKSSSSSSKNYLKELQLSRNVEHYHSASNHLAYNHGSKLQKPTNDHDIPDYISPTSNSKMHLETKDDRVQELHVSKVCETTISSSCDVQIIDKPADINCRLKCTAQSKCVSSDMNSFGDDSNTHCLSQDTAVDGNSVCGVASENEDQHCMATFQSIPANSTFTESVTTCINTSGVLKTAKYDTNQKNLTVFEISNSISSVYDKDQSVIKPEEISIFSSGVEAQKIKVDKVDLHSTEKSTSQKHRSVCGLYKYTRDIHGQNHPVMESQEVTIFHSEDETEQGTEEDKVELQISEEITSNSLVHLENTSASTTENLDLPQDIDLTCDSNKTPEVTEVDRMELQKTFKPTNQNNCVFFVKNNNCNFQDDDLPIIVPEDLSLIHPTHRMELENTNRSTGKNDSIFVTEDNYKCASQEVQPIIVPQNLYLNDYSPTIPQVTEVSRMELEKANKSTIQNDCMIIAENNECTFQDEDLPVIVPQDMSLVHPTIKTPQITEADNMELKKANKSRSQNDYMIIAESNNNSTFQNEDLPVIVPQDISLIPSALEFPQVTEEDNMELQITNVYSLTDSLEETSESDQMVEDILSTRQSEESRPPNPRDLRTPSPVLFEIYSSDESDCIILSDSETQTKDK